MRLYLAFFYSFGQVGGQLVLKFLSNIILARILLPEEIGVFVVALSVVLILNSVRDFGVNRYLIKEVDLTESKIATVYTLTISIGWGLAALIFFGRAWVVEFYAEPQFGPIFMVLAIAFMLNPLGQPTLMLMRRDLQYGRLSAIILSASLAGAAVAIISALRGVGPAALAYGVVTEAILIAVVALAFRPRLFFLRPSLKEWRNVIGFGGPATTMAVVFNLGLQAPELVIGRAIGLAEVGLFFRGQALARLGSSLVETTSNWVMGAELSALHRSGRGLRDMVLHTTKYTLVISWSGLVFLAFKAEAIILLLYGANWLPAVPILQVLALATGISMITAQSTAIYEGTGAIGLHLRNEVIIQSISVLLLLVGLRYGLNGVVWSRVASSVVIVAVHFSVLQRYAGITRGDIIALIGRQLLVTLGVAAVLGGLILLEPEGAVRDPWVLLGETVIMAPVFVILLFATRHPLRREAQVVIRGIARWAGIVIRD